MAASATGKRAGRATGRKVGAGAGRTHAGARSGPAPGKGYRYASKASLALTNLVFREIEGCEYTRFVEAWRALGPDQANEFREQLHTAIDKRMVKLGLVEHEMAGAT